MKTNYFMMAFLLMTAMPNFANAQSTRDLEEASFVMCSDMIGTPKEAEACVDWIVTSTCASTYRHRVDRIAKFLTTDALLKYQIDGEKKLPASCEAMTAVELNFDILHGLKDGSQIPTRWDRLISWAEKLDSTQRAIVVGWLLQESDISTMYSRPKVKKFITTCVNDIEASLPNVTPNMVGFLGQLARLDSSLLTPATHAVLIHDEINSQKYGLARRHLLDLRLESQSDKIKNYLVPTLESSVYLLFGHPHFDSLYGFFEAASTQKSASRALFEFLATKSETINVYENLVYEQMFDCDYNAAVSTLVSIYPKFKHDRDMDRLMKDITMQKNGYLNEKLIGAMVYQFSALDNANIDSFKHKYGSGLTALALAAGSAAIDRCDFDSAKKLLNTLDVIAPENMLADVLFQKGRLLSLQKNGALARTNWNQVIQMMRRGALAEKAYYLSMISFARDGKWQDADNLRASFVESFPESIWIQYLPTTFKGYKLAALSCK